MITMSIDLRCRDFYRAKILPLQNVHCTGVIIIPAYAERSNFSKSLAFIGHSTENYVFIIRFV